MAVSHALSVRNAIATLVCGQVDVGSNFATGVIKIFDVNAVQCSSMSFSKPAFAAPIGGVALANAIAPDLSPVDGATPTTYSVYDCNGNVVWSGTCGPTGDLGCLASPIIGAQGCSIVNFAYRAPL